MSSFSKEFVMTQKVKNISTLKKKKRIKLAREGTQLHVFFSFLASRTTDQSVHIQFSTKLMRPTGESISQSSEVCLLGGERQKYGFGFCFPWEKLVKELVVEDCLVVEVCAHILDTSGFEKKEKLRNFDESMKEFSDVVLVVKDVKFYVLKTPRRTSFANVNVIIFPDETVGGVLHIVDMYDSKMVTKNCEDFLIRTGGSKMTLKKKMQMADRYQLENLKVWLKV
eukprot:NP_001040781.1 MATH (meprin-associated Traf homology) domain containing [Caenorhabditis elegans]